MKIVFVNPIVTIERNYINIGTAILSTILENHGYNVNIVDFNYLHNEKVISTDAFFEKDYHTFAEYIISFNPTVVCFSTMINSYHVSVLVAKYIKDRLENVYIVFGGPQASLTAESSIEAFPWIDIIMVGEGETNILSVMENIKSYSAVESNDTKEKPSKRIVVNDEYIENLDELPRINYKTLIPYINSIKYFPIEIGRGCPYACKYCSTKTFWKRKFRIKSTERLINEIKYVINEFKITEFNFEHDLFTADRNRVIEFCNELKKQNLNIRWNCSSRCDTLDEELIRIMGDSGCESIFLGIETGSERMQKLSGKHLDIDTVLSKVNLLKKYNINFTAGFIYDFPEEDINDLEDTLSLILKLIKSGSNKIVYSKMTLMPGTEYWEEYHDKIKPINNIQQSSFVAGANVFNCVDFCINYPDIFPNFYEIEGTKLKNIDMLGYFIQYYIPVLAASYPILLSLLLKCFNDSLYSLYSSMYMIIVKTKNYFLHFSGGDLNKKELLFTINIDLACYIKETYFGELNDLIKETFRFENDLFNIKHNAESDYIINTYNYDFIYIAKNKNDIELYSPRRTTLRMIKKCNRTIALQRIEEIMPS